MAPDKHDFATSLLGHIDLLQGVLTRIETSIQSSQNGQEMIHEQLGNVVGGMKEDLSRIL
jgi:hypothetical protein